MDSIVFDDLERVGTEHTLIGPAPGEPGYKRILIRPSVPWKEILLCVLLPLVAACGLVCLLYSAQCSIPVSILVPVGGLMVYSVLSAKRAAIGMVHLYQHFAPDSIRNRCRFEPSCSQYMILAIEKYGLIRGVWKGIGRLRRCNMDHGGYDDP